MALELAAVDEQEPNAVGDLARPFASSKPPAKEKDLQKEGLCLALLRPFEHKAKFDNSLPEMESNTRTTTIRLRSKALLAARRPSAEAKSKSAQDRG